MVLHSLHISGIRGVPNAGLNVDFGSENTVIFGYNGSGKSSIADGIEVLLSQGGKVEYYGENVGEIRPGWKQAAHLNGTKPQVSGMLTGATKTTPRGLGEPPPPDIERLLQHMRFPRVVIRGMQAKQQTLDVSALDRGQWMDEALALGDAHAVSAKLAEIRRELRGTQKRLEDQSDRSRAAVPGSYERDINESAFIAWINGEVSRFSLSAPVLATVGNWQALSEFLRTSSLSPDDDQEITKSRQAIARLKDFLAQPATQDFGGATDAFTAARDAHGKAVVSVAAIVAESLDIIKAGLEFVRSHPTVEACPLCEQPLRARWETPLELLERLHGRLEEADEVTKTAAVLQEARQRLHSVCDQMLRAVQGMDWSILGLPPEEIGKTVGTLEKLLVLTSHSTGAHSNEDCQLPALATRLLTRLQEIARAEVDRRTPLLEVMQREQNEKKQRLQESLPQLDNAVRLFCEHLADKAHAEWAAHLNREVAAFSNAFENEIGRRREAIINAIASDVCLFCREVVSASLGEERADEFERVTFSTPEGNPRGLSLMLTFYGHEGKMPQAVLSDSRLGLLGLAINICMLRKFNTGAPIAVLDDVLTSLDPEHRLGLADVLPHWLKGFQIIVLTNDDKFMKRLRYKQFDVKRIFGWTIETGPQIEGFPSNATDIESAIQRHDAETLGAKLRPEMEGWFRDICERWGARAPVRSAADWTLSDYWSGLQGAVKEAKRKGDLPQRWIAAGGDSRTSALDQLILLVGNAATHADGNIASSLSFGEMRACWDAFKAYTELFQCACGDWFRCKTRDAKDGLVCAGKGCEGNWLEHAVERQRLRARPMDHPH